MASNPDPFDSILTLEDDLYTTAYAQGAADGSRAGRIEGRIFGLEKGFDKFAALGQLHGRAVVWGARLPAAPVLPTNLEPSVEKEKDSEAQVLRGLDGNERHRKHIQMLHGLTDPLTFSTLNTEEAVADFDDRFKRAGAKAKIIERIVGETASPKSPERDSAEAAAGNIRVSGQKTKKGDDSMEDFVGSRFLS
ncbi:uncharacterized protein CC84DRAFT_1175330 [Paraphaeosphaeria sporulosa]|uniref:Essential protein Yae1 N-terminal domain-containing protein n=1 Tax=Paraphaeosphaeria sporulosa TaxID=1460663 RepID=A0A177CKQ6_9PLEO|nr:uncharacterized protein CC84DRAFT_1175330 [Paraphaeosphaeria sporulosa]OAG07542.1 hypothetical protein CC84DRAFT_1175330 [Paraphaeosphaeria sporulosa]